jgi:hypothetical protein
MLSLAVTILRIDSQECLDKDTATLNNSMIAGWCISCMYV